MSERIDRVKAMLREGTVCSLSFYRSMHPNDRNGVSELRKMGWPIVTELGRFDCGDAPVHAHHWLLRDPEQMALGFIGSYTRVA